MTTTPSRIASIFTSNDRYTRNLAARVHRRYWAGSLDAVESAVVRAANGSIDTIDLIGHSATEDRLLMLGDEVIDARRPRVIETFTRLAPILHRQKVRAFRLLGCGTAMRSEGRRTLRALAAILAPIDLVGTADFLPARAFGPDGLRSSIRGLLVSVSDL